jgi:hypothetical protein
MRRNQQLRRLLIERFPWSLGHALERLTSRSRWSVVVGPRKGAALARWLESNGSNADALPCKSGVSMSTQARAC